MAVKRRASVFPLAAVAYGGGLVLIFLGERVFSGITGARWALSGVGVAAILGSIALRFTETNDEDAERRTVERSIAGLSILALLAIVLEFSTTDVGERLFGIAKSASETRARFEGIATVVWIALLTITTLPILFAERALMPMRSADRIEGRRVKAAGLAGLTIALSAVYGALFAYAAGELEAKVDYSYFRTARPSESTRKIIATLGEPVKLSAFFPELNDVGREVETYLKDLAHSSPNLTVATYDRLLVPSKAKEEKVTSDGVVVLTRGALRETLNLGTDMSAARPKLKTLDADFQKSLLKVTREQKTAYLTVGHGEMNEATGAAADEGRSAVGLRKLLESQNYGVKDLGLAQGLGIAVPADATVVVVLGPAQALLPGEAASLRQYSERGGHLLLALDPEAKVDLQPLADIGGVSLGHAVLANEKAHLRRRFNDSDRTILVTNKFSSHASVSTLSRNASHMPVLFAGATSLDKRQGADSNFKIDFAVRSLPDTFADANGDFQFQDAEKRTTYNLVAAVTRSVTEPAMAISDKDKDKDKGKDKAPPETRIFLLGDADALSDAALSNEPNILLFVDAIRWLGGEESFTGALSTTEDVKIEHTKQKDLVWFYGTIFAIPALVFGLGVWMGRRPRRAARAEVR